MFAFERIWRRPKNSDVVFCVHRNHVGSKKLRRTIVAADENVGLASVAKGF